MASVNGANIYNLTLAGCGAAATAFAVCAMPADLLAGWMQSLGLSRTDLSIARSASAALGAASTFLVFWLALRCCDRKPVRPHDELIEEESANWPTPLQRFQSLLANGQADNPCEELARGAKPMEAPLDLLSEQIEIEEPASDQPPCPELRDRIAPVNSISVQQLNADLAQSEWPLASRQAEEEEDRLRGVLLDLKAFARRA
jgi:hypothetical protein